MDNGTSTDPTKALPSNTMANPLRLLVDRAWHSHQRLAASTYLVKPSIPILFFGDLQRYFASSIRVVTVGLNPSKIEFPPADPFARFRTAQNLFPTTIDQEFRDTYIAALSDYFRDHPYKLWFSSYEAILNGMACSYYDCATNTALHTDLCSPLATDPTWSKLASEQRAELEKDGADIWHDLIRFLAPHVVIASVGRQHYEKLTFKIASDWSTIHTIERANPYPVQARQYRLSDGSHFHLVHGRAANTPFGTVSTADKGIIGDRIKAHTSGSRRLFVQFIHPGYEHTPEEPNVKRWNTGLHRRKFLCHPGEYVDSIEQGARREADLMFWGEWEPDSAVRKTIAEPIERGPHYVFQPFYGSPPSGKAQNTDPFVFGDCFLYSNCQQQARRSRTQMGYLDRGSVILFGSCIGLSEFVIDTVFVVDRWEEYRVADAETLRGKVPQAFVDVTLDRLARVEGQTFRLYFGATHDNPINGMFSFFPCAPWDETSKGFARPTIQIRNLITNNLTQGRRCTDEPNLDTMAEWWKDVAQQALQQGLQLGTRTQLPPKRLTGELAQTSEPRETRC